MPLARPVSLRLAGALLVATLLVPGTVAAAPSPLSQRSVGSIDAVANTIHWSFEAGLDGWQADDSSSFGPLHSCREYSSPNPIRMNNEGDCFLSTFESDGAVRELQNGYGPAFGELGRHELGLGPSPHVGTLSSPTFVLTHPTISMLIGGGDNGGEQTHVAVCVVDDAASDSCREVARLHGDDNDTFSYRTVHLPEEIGQQVFLRLVDQATTGWSHVILDDVRANAPAMPRSFEARRVETATRVSWAPVNEPGVIGYDLFRASSADEPAWPQHWDEAMWSSFEQLNDAPLTSADFVDTTASPDRTYWYRVAAVEDTGLRSESNLALLRPKLDPGLREPGAPSVYAGDQLSGVIYPVGPIGYGGLQHLGDGTRNLAWIFNVDSWVNNTTYARRDAWVPDSFFAVRAQRPGGPAVVRALQTIPLGPFSAMNSLTFQAEEPIGTYGFADDELPVTVMQHVESSTNPGDLRDSAIPTAIYTIEITNPSAAPVDVSLLATQQNAVGFDGQVKSGAIDGRNHPSYGQNHNEVVTDALGAHLQLTGCPEKPVPDRCNGGLALSMLAPGADGTASWDNLGELHKQFAELGSVTGPGVADSPGDGVTVDGALTTTFSLAPGETRAVPVVFSWYIPSSNTREHGGQGVAYSNVWNDVDAVHAEVLDRLPELRERNRVLRDALYDSTLPRYVLERLTSQIATMRTPTVYSAQNGFLGGYEGHGCCTGMPSHVWQYAQLAPRLWPEIDTAWQSQWLDQQAPDGALPYRHALPISAFDGQTGVILGAYRAWLSTGDTAWLGDYWPRIKLAMDHLVLNHDPDEDGILEGSQAMTLDQRLSGTSSWLGSMYLAALAASARMAEAMSSDADAVRYQQILELGRVNQEQLLWNGAYYVEHSDGHVVDGPDLTSTSTGTASYRNGIIADMLLGQWWSTMLGLGDLYDPEHMTQALGRLYDENFHEDFLGDSPFGPGLVGRAFARPTDAGLQMMSWPGDDRPVDAPRYHDEVWTGTEYSAAATMIQRGLVDEGLRIVRAVHDRHDGELRRDMFLWNCGSVDGGGNPFGDDECGKWYARAMSSWSVLLALQGFTFDAGQKSIGFAPALGAEDHRSFFSAGTAWGTYGQTRDAGHQLSALAVGSGELKLRQVSLDAGAGQPSDLTVRIDDQPVEGFEVSGDDGAVTVSLSADVVLTAGQTLFIDLSGIPLSGPASEPEVPSTQPGPASTPLPATGGGATLAGLLCLLALAVRRGLQHTSPAVMR